MRWFCSSWSSRPTGCRRLVPDSLSMLYSSSATWTGGAFPCHRSNGDTEEDYTRRRRRRPQGGGGGGGGGVGVLGPAMSNVITCDGQLQLPGLHASAVSNVATVHGQTAPTQQHDTCVYPKCDFFALRATSMQWLQSSVQAQIWLDMVPAFNSAAEDCKSCHATTAADASTDMTGLPLY